MTVAFKSPVTSANVNAKFISRTDNQNASGVINFVNGIEIAGVEVVTLPTGGTTGQVLSKSSSADFDIEWDNPGGLADGSVTTAKLADGAVTTLKIADANVTQAKLDSSTALGVAKAWVNFGGAAQTGTYSRSGTTVTITIASHGLSTGMIVNLDFTSGTATDGTYTITVTDANTFTVTDTASGATSGNVTKQTHIRSAKNVSSVSDGGTGVYTVNFTTALSNANYATIYSYSNGVAGGFGDQGNSYNESTTSVTVSARNSSGGNIDRDISLVVLGS